MFFYVNISRPLSIMSFKLIKSLYLLLVVVCCNSMLDETAKTPPSYEVSFLLERFSQLYRSLNHWCHRKHMKNS